jgi:hypothetical protein
MTLSQRLHSIMHPRAAPLAVPEMAAREVRLNNGASIAYLIRKASGRRIEPADCRIWKSVGRRLAADGRPVADYWRPETQ